VRSQLLDFTFFPDWNSVEVVQAMLSTLQAAFDYEEKSVDGM